MTFSSPIAWRSRSKSAAVSVVRTWPSSRRAFALPQSWAYRSVLVRHYFIAFAVAGT